MRAGDSLLELVRQSGSVLLTGPEGPDGDSIGACLALQSALRHLVPGVRVDVAGDPGFRYAWMPGAAEMVPDAAVGAYDGVVVLDGDRRRLLPPVDKAFRAARWTGLVDHHRSTDVGGYTWWLFDPGAESTCVMIRGLLGEWGVALDAENSAQIYAGLIFDTGGFRYSNTRASSHRVAAELLETGIDHAAIMMKVLVERRLSGLKLLARMLTEAQFWADGRIAVATYTLAMAAELGASELDVEGVVDALQHTAGVDLAVVLVERAPAKVKVSLRSRGAVDVSVLAKRLNDGGGGHAKAAGAMLFAPLAEVLATVRPAVEGALAG